uniref:Uncharacterized protein n=1 Tax=Vannella robusta TaxID=1487602 RepID=A0A7S4MIN6_9EUKA
MAESDYTYTVCMSNSTSIPTDPSSCVPVGANTWTTISSYSSGVCLVTSYTQEDVVPQNVFMFGVRPSGYSNGTFPTATAFVNGMPLTCIQNQQGQHSEDMDYTCLNPLPFTTTNSYFVTVSGSDSDQPVDVYSGFVGGALESCFSKYPN